MKQPDLKLCAILPFLLLASCKDDNTNTLAEKETSDQTSSSRSFYVGIWKAEGPLPMGYNYGNYSIRIEADESGDCTATVVHQTKKSALSEEFTDTIDLAGKWELSEEGMTADLKVRSWVTTDPGTYRKEKDFEDFTTAYGFRRSGDLLVMANGMEHHGSFKVGTTEEARDGMKMLVEGRGHQLHGPRFFKMEEQLPMPKEPSQSDSNGAPAGRLENAVEESSSAPDPVGEWATKGRTPKFSLCFWESGEARGEFEDVGTSIYLKGRWQTLTEGRWIGHVVFSGKVTHWGEGQENVTPVDETFEFKFDPGGSKMTYVRGGVLKNKNGKSFHPSGIQANEDPVLHRLNNRRPTHIEPGNK